MPWRGCLDKAHRRGHNRGMPYMLILKAPISCIMCGKTHSIQVPGEEGDNYLRLRGMPGKYIQDLLPSASAQDREVLISGVGPDCWDRMIGDED
jgi:hypothetical protein